MTTALPHIRSMAAYALAKVDVPPDVEVLTLNQNESAFPPSPRAIAAASDAAQRAADYSDPDWTALRRAIAEVHGVDADGLLIGAGSMELIGAVIQAFAGPGDDVLSTDHGYAYFRTASQIAQADYRSAAEVDLTVSVDSLLAAVTDRTRVVCVANPGNPTGTRIDRSSVLRLRDGLPDDILLIVDEAYAEFADHLGERFFDLVDHGNTVVLRTFSKAYGLAGARVGWGLFPPSVRQEVRKLLNPNNVSGVSQAMATATMLDQAYMKDVCQKTTARRDGFAAELRTLGLRCPESFTNFTLIEFENEDDAAGADSALRRQGIVMRPMGFYGLGHCLRATIASEDDMMRTARALRDWAETRK